MGNRKTFKDFLNKSNISKDDYLIGYDEPIPGGEKKFKLSDLRNFVKTNEIIRLGKSAILPILDQDDPANSNSLSNNVNLPEVPFLSGKIFHIESSDHALIELPSLDEYTDMNVMCIVVNMTNHKRVELKTINGSTALHARGVRQYSSGLSDATTVTYLKKKYDTGIFYYNNGVWYGYGDLDGPTSLNIKNITTDYEFSLEDEDKILHFLGKTENNNSDSDNGTLISLPNPTNMKSGTQFFVHNISNSWIEFKVETGVNFHARAKYLRRKYDDAIIYTDGVDWFATGDLS